MKYDTVIKIILMKENTMSKQYLFAILRDADVETLIAIVEKEKWEQMESNPAADVEFEKLEDSVVPEGFYEVSDNIYETDIEEEEDIQDYLVKKGFIESRTLRDYLMSEIEEK